MFDWKSRIIQKDSTIKEALTILEKIGVASNVLFVADDNQKLLGSVTDGDIRRGLLNDIPLSDEVYKVMHSPCKKSVNYELNNTLLLECRVLGILFVPVVDTEERLIDIINLYDYRQLIPVDAVIMAGGRGERLMPLTKNVPKPMLKIGDKPIIERNVEHLQKFGIKNICISVNYLGHIIQDHFKDGTSKGLNIQYIHEQEPLGTIGALSLAPCFKQDVILLMNSDLLTNIDLGHFYNEFISEGADMAVATIPYHVDLPYAVLELNENMISSLKEKPRYTYFANAGIYMMRREITELIPKGRHYNATDLMEKVIAEGKKLIQFPIFGYWLDIGNPDDFRKAQEDIKRINFY